MGSRSIRPPPLPATATATITGAPQGAPPVAFLLPLPSGATAAVVGGAPCGLAAAAAAAAAPVAAACGGHRRRRIWARASLPRRRWLGRALKPGAAAAAADGGRGEQRRRRRGTPAVTAAATPAADTDGDGNGDGDAASEAVDALDSGGGAFSPGAPATALDSVAAAAAAAATAAVAAAATGTPEGTSSAEAAATAAATPTANDDVDADAEDDGIFAVFSAATSDDTAWVAGPSPPLNDGEDPSPLPDQWSQRAAAAKATMTVPGVVDIRSAWTVSAAERGRLRLEAHHQVFVRIEMTRQFEAAVGRHVAVRRRAAAAAAQAAVAAAATATAAAAVAAPPASDPATPDPPVFSVGESDEDAAAAADTAAAAATAAAGAAAAITAATAGRASTGDPFWVLRLVANPSWGVNAGVVPDPPRYVVRQVAAPAAPAASVVFKGGATGDDSGDVSAEMAASSAAAAAGVAATRAWVGAVARMGREMVGDNPPYTVEYACLGAYGDVGLSGAAAVAAFGPPAGEGGADRGGVGTGAKGGIVACDYVNANWARRGAVAALREVLLGYGRESVGCTPGGDADAANDRSNDGGGGGGDDDPLCRVDEYVSVPVGASESTPRDGRSGADGGDGVSGGVGGGPATLPSMPTAATTPPPALAFFVLQSITSPSFFKTVEVFPTAASLRAHEQGRRAAFREAAAPHLAAVSIMRQCYELVARA